MKLSDNFWLNEFTDSETALAIGDKNEPDQACIANLCQLAVALEGVRAILGSAVVISSGYRSPRVNSAVGGVVNSDHILGMAADIKVPGFGSPREVAAAIVPIMEEVGLEQVINEFGRWVHVSIREPSKEVNRVLTIDNQGVRAGILPVR